MLALAPLVVHETSGCLFVNKPPGLGFHRDEAQGDEGLLPLLRKMQEREALFSVHRLDRVTSGLILVAKTAEAAAEASELFRSRRVDKYYVALSARRGAKKQGHVTGDMVRSRRGQWRLERSMVNPARTSFVSRSLETATDGARRAYLLKPLTGRTHQIRVAMKSLGAPVLGDPMYASAEDAAREERAYLHAAAVRLPAGCTALVDGGGALSVLCPPHEGAAFQSAGFARAWSEWFPFGECAGGRAPCGALLDGHERWFEGTPVASRVGR